MATTKGKRKEEELEEGEEKGRMIYDWENTFISWSPGVFLVPQKEKKQNE